MTSPDGGLLLDEIGKVTLDSRGGGTVKLSPGSSRASWHVDTASVATSSNTLEPMCKLYLNDSPLGGTYTGSNDTMGPDCWVRNGYIRAVWTGGDVGAIATLTVHGTVYTGR